MDKHIVKQWIGILLLAFIVCGLGWFNAGKPWRTCG